MSYGVRVVRGPNWRWDDQDGGKAEGNVYHVGTAILGERNDGWVKVVWDCGRQNFYRAGEHGACDLRVFDIATLGTMRKPLQLFNRFSTLNMCHYLLNINLSE